MNDQSGTPEERRSVSERLVRDHLNLTAAGDLNAVEANVTSNYFNHRSADEPMDTREHGPDGLKATGVSEDGESRIEDGEIAPPERVSVSE